MSQDELAHLTGYETRSSVTKIETSVNGLPQKKITQFAKALKTTEAYLVGATDDPEWRMPDRAFSMTDFEQKLVEQFRKADDEKKHIVCYLLNMGE
jgi:transcriptional regulator with XRE-family HTH domain